MATKVQKYVDNGDDTFSPALGPVTIAAASTAAVTSVASSATVVTVLASNSSRKGGSIFNDSTQVLTIKAGAGASQTSLTAKISVGGYYEIPFNYTGVITGLWVSADGSARVTEYA